MWLKNIIWVFLFLTLTGCFLQPRPVTIQSIEDAVSAGVDSRLIAEKIDEKGIDFEWNAANRRKLSKVKADKIIFNAIVKANKKNKNNQSK